MNKGKEYEDLQWRLNNHYYQDEEGRIILTELALFKEGQCCGNKCRHCPYWPKYQKGKRLNREIVRKLDGNC